MGFRGLGRMGGLVIVVFLLYEGSELFRLELIRDRGVLRIRRG